jgi:hypothetical protein
MILTCRCKHEFQDKLYGKHRRVHNPMAKTPGAYRCTVCGAETTGRRGDGKSSNKDEEKGKVKTRAKDRREGKD